MVEPAGADASWARFEALGPELAAAGRRLLVGADGVAIGFLASAWPGQPGTRPVRRSWRLPA